MADFIEVTGLEQIRPGAGSRFMVLDKETAIFTRRDERGSRAVV